MPIRTTCSCGQVLQAKDEHAGKQVRCPKCSAVVTMPAPQATSRPPGSKSPQPQLQKSKPQKQPQKPKQPTQQKPQQQRPAKPAAPAPPPAAPDPNNPFLTAAVPNAGGSSDPFAGMDGGNSSDPFAALSPAAGGNDPFADLGTPATSSDPFAALAPAASTAAAPATGGGWGGAQKSSGPSYSGEVGKPANYGYPMHSLGATDIIGMGVKLATNHFFKLIGVILTVTAPVFGIAILVFRQTQGGPIGRMPLSSQILAGFMMTCYGAAIMMALAGCVFVIAKAYTNRNVSVIEAIKFSAGRVLPLWGTYLLLTLMLAGGFFVAAFVISRIIVNVESFVMVMMVLGVLLTILGYRIALTPLVVIVEGTWGLEAMRRSFSLAEDNGLTFFAMVVINGIMDTVALAGIMLIARDMPLIVVVLLPCWWLFVQVSGFCQWIAFYISCRAEHERVTVDELAADLDR